MDQSQLSSKSTHGRGAQFDPHNRFEQIVVELDEEFDPSITRPLKTQFFNDTTRSIITSSDSPDLGPITTLNPYRGCEHGCSYCFARPTHEYLGLSLGLDFESKIFVKKDAPALLERTLSKKSWQPRPVIMSGATDPYQPIEKRLEITRQCLEVFLKFRNPVGIITKSFLITRDIDILKELAHYECITANISITTLDMKLASLMEPRASVAENRLRAIETLTKHGVPVRVMVAPVIPGLNDHEIPNILKSAAEAGAVSAGHVMLRLPYAIKDVFVNWLEKFYPEKKDKVISRIKAMRGGKLYDADFSQRMSGTGSYAHNIHQLFSVSCRKYGLNKTPMRTSTQHFQNNHNAQYGLFE